MHTTRVLEVSIVRYVALRRWLTVVGSGCCWLATLSVSSHVRSGTYAPLRYLASGSFCHCFTAVDTLTDREVCLKTFKPPHFYFDEDSGNSWVQKARDDNVRGLLAYRNQKRLQEQQAGNMVRARARRVNTVHVLCVPERARARTRPQTQITAPLSLSQVSRTLFAARTCTLIHT